ncbi:exo-beta-N-acetylmuramidase NamZ domain-containing protein, partial [Zeaxanthinibacter enoshimensis]|uniref:exo-beta-N-acetylmuramidase NamZ domain-containing protein n=1 Tax=Zeaxanthinibacter enoshimensis TaxID=392009 RepID=UPI0035648009
MGLFSGFKNTVFLWLFIILSCGNRGKAVADSEVSDPGDPLPPAVVVAANKTGSYIPLLKDKNTAVVANQTSVIFKDSAGRDSLLSHTHLVDSLLALGVSVKKVFAPEHGFRGDADAGEKVKDGVDTTTGLPIISLYGKNRKPTPEQLQGIDIVLFDIQDVGVRFYTYIATLQLVMEAAAEAGIPVLVLDRPNPNAHYIDGPTMEKEHTGFLGMTTIPLVYG